MQRIVGLLLLLLITSAGYGQNSERIVLFSTTMGDIKCRLYNDTPLHRDKFIADANNGFYNGTLFYRVIKGFMIQGGGKDSRNAAPGARIGYGDPAFTVNDEIRANHFHKRGALCAPRQPDAENPFKQSDISQFFMIQGRPYRSGELDTLELARNQPIQRQIRSRLMTPEITAKLKQLKEENRVEEFRAIADPIKEQIEAQFLLHPERLKFTDEQRKAYTTVGGYPLLDGQYTIFGEVISGLEVIDKIAALKTDGNDRPLADVRITVRIIN